MVENIEIENLEKVSDDRLQDIIEDYSRKKEDEGLSEIEADVLKIALEIVEFKQGEVDEKIKAEIKKSKDAGEELFADEKDEPKEE